MKGLLTVILTLLFLFTIPLITRASETDSLSKEFNTVEFLFDHIGDSHEWHFFTMGDKHFSIPLPVILYSKHSGFHIFSSAKFHHPPAQFNFYIDKGGPHDGKIVETLSDGNAFLPLDISLTKSVANTIIVAFILIFVSVRTARKAAQNRGKTPKGTHTVLETFIVFIRENIAKVYIGDKYERFLPFLTSLFTFIFLANLMGLILPLGFNVTSNIAITLVLASFTLLTTMIHGNKRYWRHIFNPDVPIFMKTPVAPLMQIVEIMGVIIKPTILMIRLFANMLAGHMIITSLVALIFLMNHTVGAIAGGAASVFAVVFSLFIVFLDILVSFIQTYIFTLLSALYIGFATDDGH